MLEIYYGNTGSKNRLCVGTAVLAALRNKNVLYVRFLRDGEKIGRLLGECAPNVVLLESELPESPDEFTGDRRSYAARLTREFFDKAVRMALTFKYEVLLLDRIFDVIGAELLPSSEVYEFLSDAPDRVEIICTGHEPEERFLALADEAVRLTETHSAEQ